MTFEKKTFKIELTDEDKKSMDRLDKWGGFLNDLMDISDKTLVLCDIGLISVLIYTMVTQSIYWINGTVLGLLTYVHPWFVWAIKFMGINISGFVITDLLLGVTGIYVGMYYLNGVIACLIDKANDDVEEIISKYMEEDNNNE